MSAPPTPAREVAAAKGARPGRPRKLGADQLAAARATLAARDAISIADFGVCAEVFEHRRVSNRPALPCFRLVVVLHEEFAIFMDADTFDLVHISGQVLGDAEKFLLEYMSVQVATHEGEVLYSVSCR